MSTNMKKRNRVKKLIGIKAAEPFVSRVSRIKPFVEPKLPPIKTTDGSDVTLGMTLWSGPGQYSKKRTLESWKVIEVNLSTRTARLRHKNGRECLYHVEIDRLNRSYNSETQIFASPLAAKALIVARCREKLRRETKSYLSGLRDKRAAAKELSRAIDWFPKR